MRGKVDFVSADNYQADVSVYRKLSSGIWNDLCPPNNSIKCSFSRTNKIKLMKRSRVYHIHIKFALTCFGRFVLFKISLLIYVVMLIILEFLIKPTKL